MLGPLPPSFAAPSNYIHLRTYTTKFCNKVSSYIDRCRKLVKKKNLNVLTPYFRWRKDRNIMEKEIVWKRKDIRGNKYINIIITLSRLIKLGVY